MKWLDQPMRPCWRPWAYSSVRVPAEMIQANSSPRVSVGVGVRGCLPAESWRRIPRSTAPQTRSPVRRARREHQARPGIVRTQSRKHKYASTDDRPHAQRGQLDRTQACVFRLSSPASFAFREQHAHRFLANKGLPMQLLL